MQIILRTATLDDVPALQKLIPESVRVLSKAYYSERQIEAAIQDVFGVDSQLIHDETYYVVEAGSELAGCGGWSKRSTMYGGDQLTSIRADNLLDPTQEPARIRAFFILPKWSRKGIGRQLLDQCERDAYDAGFQSLELVATLPGEPFYRKMGFEEKERIHVPLSNGDSMEGLSMHKSISRLQL